MKKTVYTIFLCLFFANTALAAPYDLHFTSTVSYNNLASGVTVGDSFEITVRVDNGGTTAVNQTWQYADIESVRFSVKGGAYTANFPRSTFIDLATAGSIQTDGAGVVSSSLAGWTANITANNIDSDGNALTYWFIDGLNPVLFAAISFGKAISAADSTNNSSLWTVSASAPATAKAVPTMSVYGLIFTAFGVLLVATRRLRNIAWKR